MLGHISVLEQYLHAYQSAFSQEEDPRGIVSDLLVILRNYSLWEQEIHALAERHSPLSDLLTKSAEIIHNPILIFDLEGNLLGQSNLEKATSYSIFSHIAKHGVMPAYALTYRYINQLGQYSQDLTDTPQLNRPEDGTEPECLSLYLSIDNERIGYCLLAILDPQEMELDRQFLSFLKPYFLQAAEFTDAASPTRSNQSIVTDLLSGAESSRDAIHKFLKNTGIGSPFQLLEIQSNSVVNYSQRSMVVRDLNNLSMPLFSMDYENRVLVLTGAAQTEQLVQCISQSIQSQSSHFTVGISMPFSSMESLSAAHLQSVFAIEESGCRDGFFYCQDFAFNYLLRILDREALTRKLLHPAVGILTQYDLEYGTELLKTLHVYLRNSMNQIHTANELYIHRNTLKYRLARIVELTGIDLSDGEDTLYLSLSLQFV